MEESFDGLTEENFLNRIRWRKKWELYARDIKHNLPVPFKIVVGTTSGMKYPYVQVCSYRPDAITGEQEWGGGGKAYISEFATASEFYQMVLGLGIAYVQHEYREGFYVNGERPFHPHISTQALVEASKQTDARKIPTLVANS